MQCKGHFLASVLLLLPVVSYISAGKTDDLTSHLAKRSTVDVLGDQPAWPAEDLTADKRFNEFVGKRSDTSLSDHKHFNLLAKQNPDQFMSRRLASDFFAKPQYDFLNKRPVSSRPDLKRAMYDLYGKRMDLPYEFLGKRIFGTAWTRVSANGVEEDALVKDVVDSLGKREDSQKSGQKNKRYSEWLGKRGSPVIQTRGGPITDQLLRDLVNKRISAMMRNRMQSSSNPEFVGRREEDYLSQPEGLDVKKRYTEFIGK